MAVSNTFPGWTPFESLFPDNPVFDIPSQTSNYSSEHKPATRYGKSYHGVSNILPYFMSLGLLTPSKENELSSESYVETTGPFKTVYHWNQLDFVYPTPQDRESAIMRGDFIPENNLPLGIEVYEDRLFVSMPKWKNGVPITLAVVPKDADESSPALAPYPSWWWHDTDSCMGLTSVFRVKADTCGRLWVLDSGQIQVTIKPKPVCPPAIFIFDLYTDRLILRYELPKDQVKQDGLFSNIMIDIVEGECDNAHAYLTDVWRYGLVVYSLRRNRSWRITDHLFYPDPLAAAYNLHGVEFQWVDGIFAMSLSPFGDQQNDSLLFFHPMSSFREFYVKRSVICNETGWQDVKNAFKVIGQSRGPNGHVSSSGMNRDGIMFFNLITRDSIGCWDSRKPYKRSNLGVVAKDHETLVFPNDLKIDNEARESVWILTNKLPYFLYRKLNPHEINFRVMRAYADEAISGTICDPEVSYPHTYDHYPDGGDCF